MMDGFEVLEFIKLLRHCTIGTSEILNIINTRCPVGRCTLTFSRWDGDPMQ